MVFCPKWVQLPVFTSLSFFFIGLMISGLVFPTAINEVQTGGIKTEAQFNPAKMSTSSLNTFYNTTTNITYFVWNLTNYKSVLVDGSLPVYAEVGPIPMIKHRYRVDVDWSNPDQASYKFIELYDVPIGDPVWESIKTAPIISPNVLLWGTLAQVAQTVATSTTGKGTPGPNLAESNLCAALATSFGTELFPSLNNDFNNATGALLTAFRFVSVPIYFNLVFGELQELYGVPHSQAAVNWGSASQAYASQYNNPGLLGFELLTPLDGSLQDIINKVTNIFSSSNPFSLVFTGNPPPGLKAAGINLWLAFANAAVSVPFDTITYTELATAITTGLQITLNDANNIIKWIAALTAANNPVYFSLISQFLTNFLKWTPYSSDPVNHGPVQAAYDLTSWEDVGRVQFGTGIITTIFIALSNPGDPVKGYNTTAAGITSVGSLLQYGVPTSVFDVFPSFAPNPSNPLPYEWYTAIYRFANQYPHSNLYLNGGGTAGEFNLPNNPTGYASTMNKTEVNTFLTTMASGGATIVQGLLSALSAAKAGVGFAAFSGEFPPLAPLVPLFPYTFTPPSPLPNAAGLNRYLDLNNWLLGFICNSTIQSTFYGAVWPNPPGAANELADDGISEVFGSDGVTVVGGNNGLFRRMKVYETLFGYRDPVIGQDVPGLVGLLAVDVRNYGASGLPGSENAYSEQQLIDNYRASMQNNFNTIFTTGRDNVNRVGQYVQYNGFGALTDYCSLIDPSSVSTCGVPSVAQQNARYRIWGKDEVIDGSTDGTTYPPLETSPPSPLSLYVEQVRRNAFLVYDSDVLFKDIFLHQYLLDPRILKWDVFIDPVSGNQTQVDNIYRNADYRLHPSFTPNGVVHVTSAFGGLPLFVSLPHFLQGDSLEFSKLGGLHPNVTIHQTFVEVEPQLGRTMNFAKRLQASFWGDYYTKPSFIFQDNNNAVINPQFDFTFTGYFKNVFPNTPGNPSIPATQTYFPYYWADEDASINDSDASTFKSSIYDLWHLGRLLRIIFSVVGGVFGILFSYLASRACKTTSAKNGTAY